MFTTPCQNPDLCKVQNHRIGTQAACMNTSASSRGSASPLKASLPPSPAGSGFPAAQFHRESIEAHEAAEMEARAFGERYYNGSGEHEARVSEQVSVIQSSSKVREVAEFLSEDWRNDPRDVAMVEEKLDEFHMPAIGGRGRGYQLEAVNEVVRSRYGLPPALPSRPRRMLSDPYIREHAEHALHLLDGGKREDYADRVSRLQGRLKALGLESSDRTVEKLLDECHDVRQEKLEEHGRKFPSQPPYSWKPLVVRDALEEYEELI